MGCSWIREEELGRGGFGFVSKARTVNDSHSDLPAVMAVKSVKVSSEKTAFKEKVLLDKFKDCSCIVHCFGDDHTTEDGEELYNIFLEFASGGCLVDRVLNGKGLPEHLVKRYTKSLITALSHMHKLGYVHCDVKPHNVLLVKQGTNLNEEETAKLADLGSAKRFGPRDPNEEEQEEEDDGGFRGTIMYAAPESISREEYSPDSDVWSMGCTILYILTGKAPWKFDKKKKATASDMLLKIASGNEIPEIPKNKISKEAADFLSKCLVKDPRARWKLDMLLDHPFLKMDHKSNRHHHHHIINHGLSKKLHSFLPHNCFHPSNRVHAF